MKGPDSEITISIKNNSCKDSLLAWNWFRIDRKVGECTGYCSLLRAILSLETVTVRSPSL